MMKNRFGFKLIALMLTLMFVLSGCGDVVVEDVPELLEPVSTNVAYRPVDRGYIGKPTVLIGQVVPEEQCYFFKRSTTLSKINCEVGQWVNKGDVVAVADVEKYQDELVEIKASLELLQKEHETALPIHEATIKSLEYQKQGCLYLDDQEGARDIATKINQEYENYGYDEQMYQIMVDSYNRDIAELEEYLADGTLRARESGYVTYIKNTASTNTVGAYENVVITSDYEDLYITTHDISAQSYNYRNFELKAAYLSGELVDLEEYDYTVEESVLARSQSRYPNMRFKMIDGYDLKMGDNVLLFFQKSKKLDSLRVGLDSTNYDDGGNYVFVKIDNNTVEKRYVTLGNSDEHYIEVLDGLSEGEIVQCVQSSATPAKYEPIEVKSKEYIYRTESKQFTKSKSEYKAYVTPCTGMVKEIFVTNLEEVKKGDPLLTIDSGSGSAEIMELELKIKHLDEDYLKDTEELEKLISETKTNNLLILTQIEQMSEGDGYDRFEHEIDELGTRRTVLDQEVLILEQQRIINELHYNYNRNNLVRQLNKLKKDNNGSGLITVYAESDSTVNEIYARVGDTVKLNDKSSLLLNCAIPAEDEILVSMNGNDAQKAKDGTINVGMGKTVFFDWTDEDYHGEILGSMNNDGEAYAFTTDKTYVTYNASGQYQNNNLIVKVDNTNIFNGATMKEAHCMVEVYRFENVVVIPGKYMYSEKKLSGKDLSYFVWKIVDGQLVKQYITTGTSIGVGNDNEVVVLQGLKEGDILAGENAMSEEGSDD